MTEAGRGPYQGPQPGSHDLDALLRKKRQLERQQSQMDLALQSLSPDEQEAS